MSGDCASRILWYFAGSLQVNVPDETFSCHIRDIDSQSKTTSLVVLYRLFGRRQEFINTCRIEATIFSVALTQSLGKAILTQYQVKQDIIWCRAPSWLAQFYCGSGCECDNREKFSPDSLMIYNMIKKQQKYSDELYYLPMWFFTIHPYDNILPNSFKV